MLGLFVWCHYRCVQLNTLLSAGGSSCTPGPYGAGIFDPRAWGNEDSTNTVVLEFTRVVLAIGVFAIGVELPKSIHATPLEKSFLPFGSRDDLGPFTFILFFLFNMSL